MLSSLRRVVPTLTVSLSVISTLGQQIESIDSVYKAQKDCPLWIVGRTITGEDLFANVYVANNSPRTILRAQLAWIIADKDHPQRQVISIGTPFDLNLPPSQIREVGRQGAAVSLMNETLGKMGASRGLVSLGVIHVRFDDGSDWRFPLADKRAFEVVDDAEVTRKFGARIKEYFDKRPQSTASAGGAAHQRRCLTEAEVKVVKAAFMQGGGCGSQGFNPWVMTCTAEWHICSVSGISCTDYGCPGYGCQTKCCPINICTGQRLC